MEPPSAPGPDDLYVHLAADGGVFVAPAGEPVRNAWVTVADLEARLSALAPGAVVWLSEPEPSPLTVAPNEAVRSGGRGVVAAASVDQVERPDGGTALLAAADVGAVHLLVDLLGRGAPVDQTDDRGRTALGVAAQAGQDEVAGLLLAAGADVDAPDHEGTTPLMYAAWEGHAPVVTRLRSAGADADRTRTSPVGDDRPVDAADLAAGRGHTDVLVALARPEPTSSPTVAAVPGRVRYEAGIDLSAILRVAVTALVLLTVPVVLIGRSIAAGPAGVVVAAGLHLALTGAIALLWRSSRRAALELDDHRVTVEPALGAVRSFALADVVAVRRRRASAAVEYVVELRPGAPGPRTVAVPVAPFGDDAVAALLGRLAASGVEVASS